MGTSDNVDFKEQMEVWLRTYCAALTGVSSALQGTANADIKFSVMQANASLHEYRVAHRAIKLSMELSEKFRSAGEKLPQKRASATLKKRFAK